jgi:predicted ATP-dependent protease
MIAEGTLLIDTQGAKPGQVNGLSVLEIGGYALEARSHHCLRRHGKTGLINIEREANLSGRPQ